MASSACDFDGCSSFRLLERVRGRGGWGGGGGCMRYGSWGQGQGMGFPFGLCGCASSIAFWPVRPRCPLRSKLWCIPVLKNLPLGCDSTHSPSDSVQPLRPMVVKSGIGISNAERPTVKSRGEHKTRCPLDSRAADGAKA